MALNHKVWPVYGLPDHSHEKAPRTPFGQRLRDLRHARNLSQAALAARAGISQQAVHRIELGLNSATLDTLNKIAIGLNVSVGELTGSKAIGGVDVMDDLLIALDAAEHEIGRIRRAATALAAMQEKRHDMPALPN